MDRCFVIQPFDSGDFDARFEQVLKPAIIAAELEAYRVDQDPKVSIPIDEIEAGIRDSRVCLADISEDNPNVWFELGFAIAARKQVVLICAAARREKFPFDVQHRSIIKYKTGSPADFKALSESVTSRIQGAMEKADTISSAASISKLQTIEGLEQIEVVALAALAESIDASDGYASIRTIRADMERTGFTGVAASIAIKSLADRGFIEEDRGQDWNGDAYSICKLTDAGWAWVIENRARFVLQKQPKRPPPQDFDDSDIPF